MRLTSRKHMRSLFGGSIAIAGVTGLFFPDSFSAVGIKTAQTLGAIDLTAILCALVFLAFSWTYLTQRKRRLLHEYLGALLVAQREISRAQSDACSRLQRFEALYLDDLKETHSNSDLSKLEQTYENDKQHIMCDFLCIVTSHLKNCVLAYFKQIGVTDESCRVVRKTVTPPGFTNPETPGVSVVGNILDVGNWTYVNSIWDQGTYKKIYDENKKEREKSQHLKKFKISEYPELERLARRQIEYFWNNNLAGYRTVDDKPYTNPTNDWEKRYNSKAMVPIQEKLKKNNARPGLYGFVSIDSPNQKQVELFGNDTNCSVIGLMIEIADRLFVFFEQMERTLSNIQQIRNDRVKCFKQDINIERRNPQRYAIH